MCGTKHQLAFRNKSGGLLESLSNPTKNVSIGRYINFFYQIHGMTTWTAIQIIAKISLKNHNHDSEEISEGVETDRILASKFGRFYCKLLQIIPQQITLYHQPHHLFTAK